MNYKIAVIPGDGIGPEVTAEAVKALDAAGKKFGHEFDYTYLLAGGAAIDQYGRCLPEETVETAKKADAVLLGAVGGPKWDDLPGDQRPEKALLGLRKELGLFANLRPAIMFDELKAACPLKEEKVRGGLDLLVVRELTGGIYFGERGVKDTENMGKAAYDVELYSEKEVERVAEIAFSMAMKRNKKVIGVSCFVLLLLVGIMYVYVHPVNRYRLEVTRVGGSGYGYKIYERERLIIVQPFIPVVSGKRAFQSEQDARCIGNLVLERVKAGDEFAISKDDLDNLGVVY